VQDARYIILITFNLKNNQI